MRNIDIRQSKFFADFMQSIGWEIRRFDSAYVYLRKFPIIGSFAKIPRPSLIFDATKLSEFKKTNRISQLRIAPFITTDSVDAETYRNHLLSNGFKIDHEPFNPTTTIQIDLTPPEKTIFQQFSSAKRRAVRRAIKNNVAVKESNDIDAFIKIRQHQYRPLGFLITKETRTLFTMLYPKNASLLLAYTSAKQMQATASVYFQKEPIGGILLLLYNKTAYYWFASALPIGKKLFAPSLLVWEALKVAKERGCTVFDFEGIYDRRFPKAAENWKGFTKFKEGFGGKKVEYLENFKS